MEKKTQLTKQLLNGQASHLNFKDVECLTGQKYREEMAKVFEARRKHGTLEFKEDERTRKPFHPSGI